MTEKNEELKKFNEQLTGLTAEKTAIDDKINAVNAQLDALKKRIQEESASLTKPPNQSEQLKLGQDGLVEIKQSQIDEYTNNVVNDLKDQQKISFDNLKAKLLKRIEVLQQKGDMLSKEESIEYQKLKALNIPVQDPETVPEQVSNIQGGKTRKNGTKKSKTYKRVKNGKNGRKKSNTQKRVKNGTKNGKKSNRKTRK